MRKPAILILVLAFAAVGIAACGSDDSSTTSDTSAAESSAPTETTSSGGGSSVLAIAADPSALAYTTGDLDTDAGTVEIDFDNPSATGHDVQIESSDGETVGGTDVISSSTTTADVDLEPGTYTYYCSVDGHRDAGMEGTLTVK
jgi:plastocyanin